MQSTADKFRPYRADCPPFGRFLSLEFIFIFVYVSLKMIIFQNIFDFLFVFCISWLILLAKTKNAPLIYK